MKYAFYTVLLLGAYSTGFVVGYVLMHAFH